MYNGIIKARGGREEDAPKVELKDPKYRPGMTVGDWVKVYGEAIVLSHFLASRTIAIQKPMQAVLKDTGNVADAIKAGIAKAEDLTATTRVSKSKRKNRSEVEADFKAAGHNINDPKVKALIDTLF